MKRKNLVSKLFAAVVVLTLISCCFLGNTFARYTSGGDAEATVQVAKWNISAGAGTETISFDKLSPSMAAPEATGRTNSTKVTKIATITNDGDVNALVTLGAATLNITEDQIKNVPEGAEGIVSLENVKGLFTVEFYADASKAAIGDGLEVNAGETNNTAEVYAVVTWTSMDGEDGDVLDTWVGQNLESFTFSFNWTAVQNSQTANA